MVAVLRRLRRLLASNERLLELEISILCKQLAASSSRETGLMIAIAQPLNQLQGTAERSKAADKQLAAEKTRSSCKEQCLSQQLAAAACELQQAQEAKTAAAEQLAACEQQLAACRDELAGLQTEYEQLQHALGQAEAKNTQLHAKSRDLAAQLTHSIAANEQAAVALETANRDNQQLRNQLAETAARVRRLRRLHG